MKRQMMDIDGSALRNLLDTYANARNTSLAGLAREMGLSDKYLVNTCNDNRISFSASVMIEKLFGIAPDIYVAKAAPEPNVQDTAPSVDMASIATLRETVAAAVRDALLDNSVLVEWTNAMTAAYRKGMIDAREEMMRRAKRDGGAQ